MDNLMQGVFPSSSDGQVQTMVQLFLQFVIGSYCKLSDPKKWPDDKAADLLSQDHPEYDFIVVGAGSAGSVVAKRLAEVEDWNILLLEAGGDPTAESEVPAFLTFIQNTALDWSYRTEKDPRYCQGMVNQQCNWPRGKALGGSSAINAMLYVRGNKADYDEWSLMGNSGWDYKSVLEYFQKAENSSYIFKGNNVNVEEQYGKNGPQNIEPYNSVIPWKEVIKSAWKDVNERVLEDVNINSDPGISDALGTIQGGERCSTAKSYLGKVINKTNLHVVKNARVLKLSINGSDNVAEGIYVDIDGQKRYIKTKKEVILSAGSINTPQILMLSGIGPNKHLEELEIKVKANLNVGMRLRDHVVLPVVFSIKNQDPVLNYDPATYVNQIISEYMLRRSGPFSTIGITDLIGFIETNSLKTGVPDIQFHHFYSAVNDRLGLPNYLNKNGFNEEYKNIVEEINREKSILIFLITLLKPKSAGRVELNNTNPFDAPLIYPEYFKDDEDIKTLLRGIKFSEKLEASDTFKRFDIKMEHIPLKTCKEHTFKTEGYWRCLIKNIATTIYHPVGTAKMGSVIDWEAVVNPELRVYKTKGLRVIDASIMPDIVRGNTNAPTIMIGEKGADLIKNEWLKGSSE